VKTDLQERLARERARLNFSIAKQLLNDKLEALKDRIAVQDAGVCGQLIEYLESVLY
jgi:hypothetical protein